jgi:Na+/melibiose symporter-like transporter
VATVVSAVIFKKPTDSFRPLFYVHTMALAGITLARLPVSRIPTMGSLLSNSLYLYLGLVLVVLAYAVIGLRPAAAVVTAILASVASIVLGIVLGIIASAMPDLLTVERSLSTLVDSLASLTTRWSRPS